MSIPTEVLTAGISAVIGALSGGGVAWWIHRQDADGQRVQQVRDALLALIDLRGQLLDAQALPPQRVEVLTQRRAMLLAVADSLAGRAARALTVHDWIALGYECQADRDFPAARAHLERAVAESKGEDLLTKVIALRFLAAYRFGAGPDQDVGVAAALYLEAVALTREQTDPYLQYNTALSLAAMAWWKANRGQSDWPAIVEQAKQFYSKASTEYPPAGQALRELEAQEREGNFGHLPVHPHEPTASSLPPRPS